jgi:hypothetical protein
MVAGWRRLPRSPALDAWAAAARGAAAGVLEAATEDAWRCGGTWFPGVDALPTDAAGALPGGPPLPPLGLPPLPLHRAQLSVTRPGYPRPWAGEGEAAFRYRLRRDAAHLDGLLPVGPHRRRMLREPHAYILGIALTRADPGAAPLTVWEGSAAAMRAALAPLLAGAPDPGAVDLTDAYQTARRAVFETCRRVTLPLEAGEAVLLHSLTLHGTAPWGEGAEADPTGRAIAFFRPCLPDPSDWIGQL